MAGILNKKERIMDVIVTREGRRQMADGNLRATFASFTDKNAFYEEDLNNGSTDPSDRLYFEASSLSSDQIIFEKDDSGILIGDIPISDMTLYGDNVFKKGVNGEYLIITGSEFNSKIQGIVTASINNFKSQRILGSIKSDENSSMSFDVTRNKLYFDINNYSPFGMNPNLCSIDVASSLPLFFDPDLGHVNNFKFLNPVHPDGGLAGDFNNINTTNGKSFNNIVNPNNFYVSDDQLNNENLPIYENYSSIVDALDLTQNNENDRDNNLIYSETINFKNTTLKNNMFCQVFEVNARGTDKKLIKLDVIKRGNFTLTQQNVDRYNQHGHSTKKVFFVGKTYKDDMGVPSFFRIFTLMFD